MPRRNRLLSAIHDLCAAASNRARLPGRCYTGSLPDSDQELESLARELHADVDRLATEIGERNVARAPKQLAEAAEYLSSQLTRSGYTPRRQEYLVDGVTCANLEVALPGTSRPDEIVVIGAHYDSVPGSPAANDNGSGVAAVLSLARTFAGLRVGRTLRFVAFVNEELPYAHTPRMGSWVYARACRERQEKITAMLSLETIGFYSDAARSQRYPPLIGLLYPSRGNFIGFIGNTRYGELVHQVVRAFRDTEMFPSQGAALPEFVSSIGRSDHWSFWQEGYPALMVTDTANFRYVHYHTAEDTVDKIDFVKLARVVRGLRGVVKSLVAVE